MLPAVYTLAIGLSRSSLQGQRLCRVDRIAQPCSLVTVSCIVHNLDVGDWVDRQPRAVVPLPDQEDDAAGAGDVIAHRGVEAPSPPLLSFES